MSLSAQRPDGAISPPGDSGPSATTAPEHQYLSFDLAGQEYGIDIQRVQEIRSAERATRIPTTPEHVLGVINLRGHVVPLIDLRRRFALAEAPAMLAQVVVVVRVSANGRSVTAGLLVDAVNEVCGIDAAALRPAPQLGAEAVQRFVDGLAVTARGLMVLLDAQRLIAESLFVEPDRQ